MLWVVQNNVFNEMRYDDIISTLTKLNVNYLPVKLVPFIHQLIPDIEVHGPVAVLGSYQLVEYAVLQHWGPGVFLNENLNVVNWLPQYGDKALNVDAVITPLSKLVLTGPTFVRPCEDSKAFPGRVVAPHDFHVWLDDVRYRNHDKPIMDMMVMAARPKPIVSEYRFFIVDGKPITGSRYKFHGRFSPDTFVPEDMWWFVTALAERWNPLRAYVMDVADTGTMDPEKVFDGYKVVELNCLNASGFYHCDMTKVVTAIEEMRFT